MGVNAAAAWRREGARQDAVAADRARVVAEERAGVAEAMAETLAGLRSRLVALRLEAARLETRIARVEAENAGRPHPLLAHRSAPTVEASEAALRCALVHAREDLRGLQEEAFDLDA